MATLIQAGETVADRRTVVFQLVGTDGITPATGEAGGQPQISSNFAAWTSVGIGVLVAIGNGRYSALLDAATVASSGTTVETRYKSGATAECPGDTAVVVDYNPYDPDSGVVTAQQVWEYGSRTLTAPTNVTTDGSTTYSQTGDAYLIAQQILNVLSSGTIVETNALVPSDGGPVEIIAGDDYYASDGGAMTITYETTLTVTSAVLIISDSVSSGTLAATNGVRSATVTAVTNGYLLSVDLPGTFTRTMKITGHNYFWLATFSNGHSRTIADGVMTVSQRPSP